MDYTKYVLKSAEELESILARKDNLFVVACNKCFKEFSTTEEPECGEFAAIAESKGYVRSYEDASSGKKRRYYQLTEAGRHHSSEKKQEWMTYQAAVSNVLSFEGGI